MRRLPLVIVIAAAIAASPALGNNPYDPAVARAATGCVALETPPGLGKTLLVLHRAYLRHQPDVHNPKVTGPVGRVHLGRCGAERHALASFDATYNGLYFGIEDQPERFVKRPGGAWTDIGNTGGDPCGSAPTALLVAWKIVHGCPA